MNTPVPSNRGAVAVTGAKPQGTGDKLRYAQNVLLAPNRALAAFDDAYPGWFSTLLQEEPWKDQSHEALVDALRRHGDRGLELRAQAQAFLAKLPPVDALRATRSEAAKIASGSADRPQTRVLIALMIGGFPNAKPADLEAYVETLIHYTTDGGFSPTVVAGACAAVAKTCTFPPAAAEFLALCEKARDAGGSKLDYLDRGIAAHERLGNLLTEVDRLGIRSEAEEREVQAERLRLGLKKWIAGGQRSWEWPWAWGPMPGEPKCTIPPELLAEFDLPPTPDFDDTKIRF